MNGLGWFWTDLLLDAGVDRLVVASNPHRGIPDRVAPRLFDWQTPTGRSMPTLHGWHYTYGTNAMRLSEYSLDEAQANIDRIMARPGGTAAWPHDVMLAQVTNKASLDNGFATDSLSDFVIRWNSEGRTPRLEIKTLDQAMDALLDAAGPLAQLSGDWPDCWADGVASTAFETSVARAGERLLPVTDMLTALGKAKDDPAQIDAVQSISLYDEHTWGACPQGPMACHSHGAEPIRTTPAEETDLVIDLPVTNPAPSTFGGPVGKAFFITQARSGLDAPKPIKGAALILADIAAGLVEQRHKGDA